jgi:hypothetical protein
MDPIGWVIGLGLVALFSIVLPPIVALILLFFLRQRARIYVLILASILAVTRLVMASFESPDLISVPLVIGAFVAVLSEGVIVFAIAAMLLNSLSQQPAVARFFGRLRAYVRPNK